MTQLTTANFTPKVLGHRRRHPRQLAGKPGGRIHVPAHRGRSRRLLLHAVRGGDVALRGAAVLLLARDEGGVGGSGRGEVERGRRVAQGSLEEGIRASSLPKDRLTAEVLNFAHRHLVNANC